MPDSTLPYTTPSNSFKIISLDHYAARLLMVSFFLPIKLGGAITIATGLYFVVRSLYIKQPVPRDNYLKALFISGFFLLLFLSIPFTPTEYLPTLSFVCQQRASLLLLPFAFAIIAPSFCEVLMEELPFFVYACMVCCIFANADFIYHVISSGKGLKPYTHVQYRSIFQYSTTIHPTYMGMFLCFSICILLFTPQFSSAGGRVIKYTFLISLLIFLLALSPKAPVIALFIIFMHYAVTHRARLLRHKRLLAAIFASIVAAWIFIPFLRQRVMEVVYGVGNEEGNVINNSVSVRRVIWDMDKWLVQHYWLTGVGPGRVMKTLQEHYFFYGLTNPLPVPYFDPHNEYVYQWLSFGILGILVFAVVLIAHFVKAVRAANYLYLYLLIILCVTFFTETVLGMQRGVVFYAVFTSLFFFYRKQQTVTTS